MPSTFLTRTNSSAVTAERKLFTISFWVKRSAVGVQHALCSAGNGGGSEEFSIRFNTSDQIDIFHYTGSYVGRLVTNRLFRDTNAWYHIYFLYDSANGTAGDRMQLYINGVRETSFATDTNPTQNDLVPWNVDERHQIGSHSWGGGSATSPLDGCMSHFYNVAGSNIAVTQFGSTDATTGEWKINTSPTISSYGTNGFLVLKDGNTATDQSPNSNDFTVTGNLTKTEDCPSNVFATFNTLIKNHGATFTNGNTTYQSPSSNPVFGSLSTLGMTSGKFYAECKYSAGSNHYLILGIADENFDANGSTPDDLGKSGTTESIGYVVNTGAYRVNNSNTSWGSAGGDGDIIQIAVDCDNNKVFFGVNGVWGASSNPETGSNGIDVSSILTGDIWFFGVSNDTGSNETVAQFNFGNGYFGTTAITSEGTNASGNGKFEYDVPSGFTALSTKGLNS